MIDLHTHTTASDGQLTPSELIIQAKQIGLSAIAITDHDTIDGLDEAVRAAKDNSIIFIPGVEIEINHPYDGEFHLLGLGLKDYKGELNKKLSELKSFRIDRNHKIIKLMNREKINITYEDVAQFAGSKVIARPHFAKCLLNKGYVNNIDEAFKKFLNPGAPFYVRKENMNLDEAIKLIHNSGGKAIIAHPQSLYLSWNKINNIFYSYKLLGLDGIEAWHSGNKKKDCTKFEKVASDLNLIVSGGSDFHDNNFKNRCLGLGAGERHIPDIFLSNYL